MTELMTVLECIGMAAAVLVLVPSWKINTATGESQ